MASKAANYQLHYISLETEEYNKVIEKTSETTNPYNLIFRAYAHFEKLEWEDSKLSFRGAQASFNHDYYSKQIKSWYSAIKAAEMLP